MIECTCSFIGQGTSTKRKAKGLFQSSSQAAFCYYQSNHSKVEAIPLNSLSEDNKQTCRLDLHTIPSMLNVKQCYGYQLFKSFGLTRQESNPCLPSTRRTL